MCKLLFITDILKINENPTKNRFQENNFIFKFSNNSIRIIEILDDCTATHSSKNSIFLISY